MQDSDLHGFGTELTGTMGKKETVTDIYTEKLQSGGPCTLMETHQQPRNLGGIIDN